MSEIVLHRIVTKSKQAAAAIPYRLSGRPGVRSFDIQAPHDDRYPEYVVTFAGPKDLDLDVLRPDILPPKR